MTVTKPTFTPGPWLVGRVGNHLSIEATVGPGLGHEVAMIRDFGDGPDSAIPVMANAKLIAAAPDLLAALKAMLESLHETHYEAYEQAVEVVARAEGRTS